MRWRTEEYRFGLIGLLASGKTALLTSLINHLEEHCPSRFRLDGDTEARIAAFEPYEPGKGWVRKKGWSYFNYPLSRDELVQSKFPTKTSVPQEFVCEFFRTDHRWTRYRIRFFDIPGERLADAPLACRSFTEWSEHMLFRFRKTALDFKISEDYFKALDSAEVTGSDLVHQFKLTLGRLITQYRRYITPSSFLLDLEGHVAPCTSPEELAAIQYAGLQGAEFAPLSPKVAEANPDLEVQFRRHYDEYRRSIVLPIFGTLGSCHGLVVLVDVLAVLASGVGSYNDNRALLKEWLNVLRPGNNMWRMMKRLAGWTLPASWRSGGIRKIAFAAPMLDRVASEADRSNMKMLLQDMLGNQPWAYPGLEAMIESCAAVVSTEILDPEKRELVGRLEDGDGSHEEKKYGVSEVPSTWPRDFEAGTYSYPFVKPDMPPIMSCPPNQINVDTIFNFLIS